MKRDRRGTVGRLIDNIYGVLFGQVRDQETDLNTLWDLVCIRMARKMLMQGKDSGSKLTKAEKKQVRQFYRPYIRFVTRKYHRIYKNEYGQFSPAFLPDDLFYTDIDRYYNDREAARYVDNKCFYPQLFSGMKQPHTIGMRRAGIWYNDKYEMLTSQDLVEAIMSEEEVVIKRAVNSEGGAGVFFVKSEQGREKILEILKDNEGDIVIQACVKQHKAYAKLHPQSVNTIRVISLLNQEGVKIYSRIIRIGVGESRLDNTCSGAFFCVVDEQGKLQKRGCMDSGQYVEQHPDLLYSLSEITVPYMDRVDEFIKKAHVRIAGFRLISWDIAVDDEGEPILIEANLSMGGIGNTQCLQGPLFGADTKKILDEVYNNKRRKWITWR